MPSLNLTNDKRLAEIARRAERLATYNLSDLRQIPETREAAIAEATALIAFADNQPGFVAGKAIEPLLEAARPLLVDGLDPNTDAHVDAMEAATFVQADVPPDINPASLADGW